MTDNYTPDIRPAAVKRMVANLKTNGYELAARMMEALSEARAAIPAGEQDERAAFEVDYAKAWNAAYDNTTNYTAADVAALREPDGSYGLDRGYLKGRWDGWQARARMAAPAAGDALALLDHPLLRDVLGHIEDAGPADVWGAAQSWMSLRDAALADQRKGDA